MSVSSFCGICSHLFQSTFLSTLNFAILFMFTTVGQPVRSDVMTTVWDAVLPSALETCTEKSYVIPNARAYLGRIRIL